eukprot:TRINITY_DN5072_c0_g1_i1.p1 TRINITY_DN5072_c0_g1~~TRINITY_DN5072_c0_g1_i1.p1  ORF type:complete len:189 (-),score=21.41 TRINITY_DN5072_c0_g1_i1:45-611(-)
MKDIEDKKLECLNSMVPTENDKEPKYKILIIEGFLLYNSPEIVSMLDVMIYLTISKRTCFYRRMTTKPVPFDYFQEILWPSFCEYNKIVLTMDREMLLLDGENPQSLITDAGTFYLEDCLEKQGYPIDKSDIENVTHEKLSTLKNNAIEKHKQNIEDKSEVIDIYNQLYPPKQLNNNNKANDESCNIQ